MITQKEVGQVGRRAFAATLVAAGVMACCALYAPGPLGYGIAASVAFWVSWLVFARLQGIARNPVDYFRKEGWGCLRTLVPAALAFVLGAIFSLSAVDMSGLDFLIFPLAITCLTVVPAAGVHCLILSKQSD